MRRIHVVILGLLWSAMGMNAVYSMYQPGGEESSVIDPRPLHTVIKKGDTFTAELLVCWAYQDQSFARKIMQVDAEGRTPLHWAYMNGFARLAEYILNHARVLGIEDQLLQMRDKNGWSARDYSRVGDDDTIEGF